MHGLATMECYLSCHEQLGRRIAGTNAQINARPAAFCRHNACAEPPRSWTIDRLHHFELVVASGLHHCECKAVRQSDEAEKNHALAGMGKSKALIVAEPAAERDWQVFVEANDAQQQTQSRLVVLLPPTADVQALRGDGGQRRMPAMHVSSMTPA